MIMIGLRGDRLTEEERSLIREYSFGGIILFSHNLKEPDQILALCRTLWDNQAHLPPFIAIDQEGGRVHRLPPPFTHFPPASQIGLKGRSELAHSVGLATARELSAVGINLNFAPVLDVNSNPDNPIIGNRSLGSDPASVTSMGGSWAQGLRDGGVIPCGKHFPGHGDTDRDSHFELPRVDKNLDSLRAVELPPFAHACRNGIESLMTAHVVYRAFDPELPATLSRAIVTQLLRQEIGYGGVVFGDDMEMKAISREFPFEEAVTLSIQAGVDVLLYCHEIEKACRAFDVLCQEGEKRPHLRENIEKSYHRIRSLKERFLAAFTGVESGAVGRLLNRWNHPKIVEEVQGSR